MSVPGERVNRVHLLVRGPSLGEGMSQYLVDRIKALPNVEVHLQTELTQLIGTPLLGLQAVYWRDRASGKEEKGTIRHVFLFIGAEPNTEWLKDCDVSVDARGFVRTGESATLSAPPGTSQERRCLPLEISRHGVFAVGEGAALVAQLHESLRETRAEHAA